jgi:hypothetical protein
VGAGILPEQGLGEGCSGLTALTAGANFVRMSEVNGPI